MEHTHQVCNLCQIYHGIDIVVTLDKRQTPFLPCRHVRETICYLYQINYVYNGYILKEYKRTITNAPDTIVTGPEMSESFCLVKFLIRQRMSVLLPTFGGPITTTTTGGGSKGVRSTNGIWCFLVFMSWVLCRKGETEKKHLNKKQQMQFFP